MKSHFKTYSAYLTPDATLALQVEALAEHQSICSVAALVDDGAEGQKRQSGIYASTPPASSTLLVRIEAHFSRWSNSGATLDLDNWITELQVLIAAALTDDVDLQSKFHLLSVIEIGIRRLVEVDGPGH